MIAPPISIPLSLSGPADQFAKAVEQHRAALLEHQQTVDKPMPVASPWVEQVIVRQPQTGPVEDRGPDEFVVLPYRIIDDTPRPPEVEQTLSVLRETIG